MSGIEATKENFLNEPLDNARKSVASSLDIDLREPKQERRIEALKKLYEKYSSSSDIDGFILREIIDLNDQLIKIYEERQEKLFELKKSTDSPSVLKIRLENIHHSSQEMVSNLKKKIHFYNSVKELYRSKSIRDLDGLNTDYMKELKRLKSICWENWLRALDVKKTLCNTIIGFENRKALLEMSKNYVDYYLFVSKASKECFEGLKQFKKEGIKEYYKELAKYRLPLQKMTDFKVFMQKKIESKLSDAVEIKTLFGGFADFQRKQLSDSINQIKDQYKRDQQDLISIINHYKKFLIQKQVLFTNESEKLVIYFKKRYVEKIDLLCSRFHMYSAEMAATNRIIPEKDVNLLKNLVEEEFKKHLNKLKISHSEKIIPLLNNFWYLEEIVGKKHALDEETMINKFSELKEIKNMNLKSMIDEFEKEKHQLKQFYDKKISLIDDESKLRVYEFDDLLESMKEECDSICCEIINLNSRFWTKVNAFFNCRARRILIDLRNQYFPYVKSWRNSSDSWMHDYLLINLHQELLKSVGEGLKDFSPSESDFYVKASEALLYYNETTRKILCDRDKMEYDQLCYLNTLPCPDLSYLETNLEEKQEVFKEKEEIFKKDYDSFYDQLLTFKG